MPPGPTSWSAVAADDYQAPVLKRAALIDAARKRDWTKLPEMLAYISDPTSDEIFVTSLIRLLAHCDDPAKIPVLLKAAGNPSPLVRGAAVEGLGQSPSLEVLQEIAAAAGDDYRLVRVRAAAALAQFPNMKPQGKAKEQLDKANRGIPGRPHGPARQLGRPLQPGELLPGAEPAEGGTGRVRRGLEAGTAGGPDPGQRRHGPCQAGGDRQGRGTAERSPEDRPRQRRGPLQPGVDQGRAGRPAGGGEASEGGLQGRPADGAAAYNLCVIVSKDRLGEALEWCKKAAELRPQEPKYAYTLAFYLLQKGDRKEGAEMLRNLIDKQPAYADSYFLLGETLEKQGKKEEAGKIYEKALRTDGIPDQVKRRIAAQLEALKQEEGRPGGK